MKSGEQQPLHQFLRSEVTDVLGQYDLFVVFTVSGKVFDGDSRRGVSTYGNVSARVV